MVRDGLTLRGTLVVPSGSAAGPFPVAMLMHGVMANRNVYRFVRLADALAERGIASVRFDLNGRGQSDGAFEDMTVPKELDDLDAVLDFARDEPGLDVSRLALVGHSQGGVDAALFAARHAGEVAALVLLAPAAVLEDACRSRSNPFPVGEEYMRTGSDLHIYETAAAYRGPACIIHGARDQIVPVSYAERFYRTYDHADLHILADDDHSLMNGLDAVEDIAVRFVERRLYPERAASVDRARFVDMLLDMRGRGQLGRLDDPGAVIPPRIREGIGRWGVTEGELAGIGGTETTADRSYDG